MTDPVPVSPRASGSCDRAAEGGAPDPAGWVRRTVADRHRLPELAEAYRGLGFETRIVAVSADRVADHCRDCFLNTACLALDIRPAGPPPAAGAT